MKQVLLIIKQLNLPKGKLAAQAAHAAVEAAHKTAKDDYKKWRTDGMAKIALQVRDEQELYTYIQQAKDQGLPTAVITDAGKTTVAPGTVTCGAIGPGEEEAIDRITGELKLL